MKLMWSSKNGHEDKLLQWVTLRREVAQYKANPKCIPERLKKTLKLLRSLKICLKAIPQKTFNRHSEIPHSYNPPDIKVSRR